MKPILFPEANCAFGKSQPEYNPLPANRSDGPGGLVTSCWELEMEDVEHIVSTIMAGKKPVIWLGQLTFGQELQPIILTTVRPTFEPLPPLRREEES